LCRHGINGFAVVRERSAGPDTDAGVDAGSSVPEREHNLSMVVRRMNSKAVAARLTRRPGGKHAAVESSGSTPTVVSLNVCVRVEISFYTGSLGIMV
jgi:hypothetical protein